MTVPNNAWVFDTGPLRHFAASGWLGVLKFLAAERPVYVPESVERELKDAAEVVPAVRSVLEADWIKVHRLVSIKELSIFAEYENRLVANGKNRGECGVLTMGQIYQCEVVIDDNTARNIAVEKGIKVTTTVPILCEAIRARQLTTPMVEALVDSLLESQFFLPFGPGGFRQFVIENALLDYEDLL